MKKLLLVMVALGTVLTVHAQFSLQKMNAAGAVAAATVKNAVITPDANQAWWGYVTNDTEKIGLGIGSATTYDNAIFIPGDHSVAGGKTIHAIRFAMMSSNVTDIKVWIASELPTDTSKGTIETVSVSPTTGDQIDVALTTPYTIPATGVYVGYSFTITQVAYQSDAYPIVTTGEDTPNGLYLRFSDGSWRNYYGEDFGSLFLQVLLEGTFADNMVTPSNFGPVYVKVGETATAKVKLTNNGLIPISSIDYTITTDNVEGAEQHLDIASPMPFNSAATIQIPIQGDAAQGVKQKTLTVTKVNGNANETTEKTANFTLYSLTEIINRNVVVEEFTGTGCGYCPRGMVGMQKLRNTFGDRFVGIAIHQYNSSDAMYIAKSSYASLGFTGAPSCSIDRKYITDPYYGNGYDICDDFSEEMEIPALASVEVSGNFDSDGKNVEAKAVCKSLFDNEYKLEFVLIADGLTGSGSGWNQSNYYYQYSSSQLPDDLAQFGSGGQNGKSSITGWSFDDVAIASSYVGGSNKVQPLTLTANTESEATYTLAMPTKTTLLNAINKEQVYVIALLVDQDGTIANAAKAKVQAYATGIHNAETAKGNAPAAFFTLDGKQLTAPQQGLNIIKMTDGTVRKVVVK